MTTATDKRRVILDAAVRVFARQGFHTCRVSDIADEAGVAYGLVYHYFTSKDQILDTLFLERWNLMLRAIEAADGSERTPRDKLRDRVVHRRLLPPRPRADEGDHRRGHAGREHVRAHPHLADIREAYALIAAIVRRAQEEGIFRSEVTPEFAAQAFYGSIEQVLTGWIFKRRRDARRVRARPGEAADRRDDLPRPRALTPAELERGGTRAESAESD